MPNKSILHKKSRGCLKSLGLFPPQRIHPRVPRYGPCRGHQCDYCRTCVTGKCCGDNQRGATSPVRTPHHHTGNPQTNRKWSKPMYSQKSLGCESYLPPPMCWAKPRPCDYLLKRRLPVLSRAKGSRPRTYSLLAFLSSFCLRNIPPSRLAPRADLLIGQSHLAYLCIHLHLGGKNSPKNTCEFPLCPWVFCKSPLIHGIPVHDV